MQLIKIFKIQCKNSSVEIFRKSIITVLLMIIFNEHNSLNFNFTILNAEVSKLFNYVCATSFRNEKTHKIKR